MNKTLLMKKTVCSLAVAFALAIGGCSNESETTKTPATETPKTEVATEVKTSKADQGVSKESFEYSRFDIYAPFTLTSDLSHLSDNQKQMIALLIDAGKIFKWYNLYDKDDVLGWPLKSLSPSYEELVEDIQINVGRGLLSKLFKSWNPLSHGQYWQDKNVIGHISDNIKQIIK